MGTSRASWLQRIFGGSGVSCSHTLPNQLTQHKGSRYHFGRRSNQSRTSGTWIIPIQMRIATIIAIQIKKRAVCLMIPMRMNIASTAAIIKNIGEVINSGITASIGVRFIVRIRICRIYRFSGVQRCKTDEETSPLRKAASTRELGVSIPNESKKSRKIFVMSEPFN